MAKKGELNKPDNQRKYRLLLQILTTILILGFLFMAYAEPNHCATPQLYYIIIFYMFITLIIVSSQNPILSLPLVIILAALLATTILSVC